MHLKNRGIYKYINIYKGIYIYIYILMQIKSQEQILQNSDWFTGDSDECAGTEEWKFWFGYFNGLDGRCG